MSPLWWPPRVGTSLMDAPLLQQFVRGILKTLSVSRKIFRCIRFRLYTATSLVLDLFVFELSEYGLASPWNFLSNFERGLSSHYFLNLSRFDQHPLPCMIICIGLWCSYLSKFFSLFDFRFWSVIVVGWRNDFVVYVDFQSPATSWSQTPPGLANSSYIDLYPSYIYEHHILYEILSFLANIVSMSVRIWMHDPEFACLYMEYRRLSGVERTMMKRRRRLRRFGGREGLKRSAGACTGWEGETSAAPALAPTGREGL